MINSGVISQISSRLGAYREAKGGEEYIFYCPYCDCGKLRLSVNPTKPHKNGKGVFQCWHCGEHGSLARLCSKLGIEYESYTTSNLTEFDSVVQSVLGNSVDRSTDRVNYALIPSEEYYPHVPEYTQAYQYLLERGFTATDINKYRMGLGIKRLRNRIILPEMEDEEMVFWQARAYDGREPKYLSPVGNKDGHVWNLYRVSLIHEHVRIAEGVFSSIRCGDNCVGMYSYNFMPGQVSALLQAGFKTYTIIFDGEVDAYVKANELASTLVSCGIAPSNVFITFVPLGNDPDDIGNEDMKRVIDNHTYNWTPDLLLQVLGGMQ